MKELKRYLEDMEAEDLRAVDLEVLREGARRGRIDSIIMTSCAASGHPGGSMSSMEMYMMAYGAARGLHRPGDLDRDRVVISHGHTSPGAYSALIFWGILERDQVVPNFRRAGSPYQGHVEREVPGIDWGTGNLGQGLSAGVGFALAARLRGSSSHVYVLMGDGEQVKGQVAEARRMAAKEGLSNLTVLVDYNHIQICGSIEDIMPANIEALWAADGWRVLRAQGHDFSSLYRAMREARSSKEPTVILCETVMGKGVSFMEGIPDYHGKALSGDRLSQALSELGSSMDEFNRMMAMRSGPLPVGHHPEVPAPNLDLGEPFTYDASAKSDNRSAFGKTLADVGARNYRVPGRTPILAFDCDLMGSVKLDGFAKACPDGFVQAGIQEHSTATAAGAASVAGVVSLWADFGVFGLDEAYNQQRLNDINGSSLKLVLTHVGLDVGEDGKTHQCVDYVGLLGNTFGWKVVVPADPNQTDRAVRWALSQRGNVCVAMGRSVLPVITAQDGSPLFAGDYAFRYGAIDLVRDGEDGVILALGPMTCRAIKAAQVLAERGLNVKVLCSASPLGIQREELLSMIGRGPVLTVEDHNVHTGLGARVAQILGLSGSSVKLRTLGVTRYGDSGSSDEVYERMGLGVDGIVSSFLDLLGANHA